MTEMIPGFEAAIYQQCMFMHRVVALVGLCLRIWAPSPEITEEVLRQQRRALRAALAAAAVTIIIISPLLEHHGLVILEVVEQEPLQDSQVVEVIVARHPPILKMETPVQVEMAVALPVAVAVLVEPVLVIQEAVRHIRHHKHLMVAQEWFHV